MSQNQLVDATKSSDSFNQKLVFVLSAMLRHFPYAQLKFIEFGGQVTLNNYIRESSTHKIKVKLLTLINDLLLEKVKRILLEINKEFAFEKVFFQD
jgi:nucleotide exchange factor SIL1